MDERKLYRSERGTIDARRRRRTNGMLTLPEVFFFFFTLFLDRAFSVRTDEIRHAGISISDCVAKIDMLAFRVFGSRPKLLFVLLEWECQNFESFCVS